MYDSLRKAELLNGMVTTLLEVATFYPLFPTHSCADVPTNISPLYKGQ